MAVAISRPVACDDCGKVHEIQGDKRGLRCKCGALTLFDE